MVNSLFYLIKFSAKYPKQSFKIIKKFFLIKYSYKALTTVDTKILIILNLCGWKTLNEFHLVLKEQKIYELSRQEAKNLNKQFEKLINYIKKTPPQEYINYIEMLLRH